LKGNRFDVTLGIISSVLTTASNANRWNVERLKQAQRNQTISRL